MHPVFIYLELLTLLTIGPSRPVTVSVTVTVVGLAAALVLRRSFRGRTIVLLGILGMMLTDGLLFVLVSSYFGLLGRAPEHVPRVPWDPFAAFHALNSGVALIGGVAAVCAAFFISFKSSRIGMAKMFPQLEFLETAPVQITETVKRLAGLAGVPPPDVWLVDSGVPSAFTVWANRKYSIALSIGLLESLDYGELEACIAHEISHLKNGDFTVRLLATLAKIALFAKPISYLVEPAIYRAREFLADKTAAQLIGGPDALISALAKLKDSRACAATSSHGLTCVCNLSGGRSLLGILDKQPDLAARIEMLYELKQA